MQNIVGINVTPTIAGIVCQGQPQIYVQITLRTFYIQEVLPSEESWIPSKK